MHKHRIIESVRGTTAFHVFRCLLLSIDTYESAQLAASSSCLLSLTIFTVSPLSPDLRSEVVGVATMVDSGDPLAGIQRRSDEHGYLRPRLLVDSLKPLLVVIRPRKWILVTCVVVSAGDKHNCMCPRCEG
ncbi:hypothetical protein QVD17_10268 [Tagetes erecta]|uniref:Uncharacterized protein n=1 Tax=Tagetes erecta TaxID=13708 RepID=A0AAD8L5F1_TARER|nr:hypothetical protein QVD17_10268 [Tagetes erecta]